jgi:Uma2 family endonuclease
MPMRVEEPRVGYALEKPRMSADEFLAWDEGQTLRHEFLRGEVYAMAGGEDRYYTAALNLAVALRLHLRGTPCRVYGSDVKLRVEAADAFFYPDLMVTCSARDAADRLHKREPVLVVEVLSPSTAGFDRGEKFAAYRTLDSLREMLLVDVAVRRCDLYRRGADELWVLHPSAGDEPVVLDSVGLTVPAAVLWAEIEGDAPPGPEPAGPPA